MSIKVLVVEDQSFNLLLMRLLMERAGHRVLTAKTAEEGMEIARRETPDLILMDVTLPGMSGLEATRLLKSEPRTRGICIVGLSAHALKGDAERALIAGCDGYVTKPIDTRTLPEYLTGLLERFRGRGE